MQRLLKRLTLKEDPSIYEDKDSHLARVLTVKDFLALGVGTIVSTSIFTYPEWWLRTMRACGSLLIHRRSHRCRPGCICLC